MTITMKQTFDMLRYGRVSPNSVRDCITDYFNNEHRDEFYTDWKNVDPYSIEDSKYMDTHFMKICVGYDLQFEKVMVCLSIDDEYSDKLTHYDYTFPGSICFTVDNEVSFDDVLDIFRDMYMDIHQNCLMIEHNLNFPNE